jgi:serine/threonine protein kinase
LRCNLQKVRLFATFCKYCKEILDSNVCDAAGLEYLHKQDPPIIHNDIKDTNVLVFNVDAKTVVKFTDFGSV